jgi:predicted exporter
MHCPPISGERIWVAVDYSLHYLTSRGVGSSVSAANAATSSNPLRALLPALSLALLTSLIGFGSLLQAPVPGLRQMAVFSMLGLISTWLFVVVVLPMTAGPAKVPSRLIRKLARAPAQLHRVWCSSKVIWLFLVVTVAVGIYQVRVGEDLRILYAPDPQLLRQQQFVESLLPGYSANQFFLLRADDEQQLLRRCEVLLPQLLEVQKRDVISGFLSPCDQLASHRTQSENRRLLQEGAYRRGGVAEQLLHTVGYDPDAVDAFRQEMKQENLLSPGQWRSIAPADLKRSLLGNLDGQYFGLIQLREISALPPLGEVAEAYPWLDFVDTVADISETLLERQHIALVLLLAAYCLIAVVLLLRYREWRALTLLCVPALSSLAVLAIVGLIGSVLSLFHVFALFLVLGLGMDYAIFYYESAGDIEDCKLAVLLSFATSALSFGLLTFSSTPMISAFGLAVLIGSVGNWLVLPIVVHRNE